ncbi:lipopolysaccharide-induced tumor necrosis factor-alpha factor homolog [Danio aesculapii]|uniref:lipopolysaccharide-induced tumor necrosis factor-alpha factor homolog n=1 Tax=Danio aesculapii TaxID=1142201 RepID=UPI0024C0D457|nr:lipopolysaccharide-induced tumor necrosis factor-alpha factor homolog [Danio aesculapii]
MACTDESGSKSPPPSYSNMDEIPLYDEIIPPPPTIKTPATPPPAYNEPNIPQGIPLNTYTEGPNPYPILNQPIQIAAVTQQQQQQQQVFVQSVNPVAPQVIVVQPQQSTTLDDTPASIVCKYCRQSIVTHVEYKPGLISWLMCIIISFLGGICGCCVIPFFVRGFQDVYHSCPSCNRHLGIYTRK